jgi:hypothetical protein
MGRTAYLLTVDPRCERALFSKQVLKTIGFRVHFVQALPKADPVVSNKLSLIEIYKLVATSAEEYSYVFEDDINVLEPITLDEIVQYEKISEMFFYLGVCEPRCPAVHPNGVRINNHDVYTKSGANRGCHAFGLSKKGARALLAFSRHHRHIQPSDIILEMFSTVYPANVVRYDLESYIPGHKGVIFQDRRRFPSTLT